MTMPASALAGVVEAARREGRRALLEPEGLELLRELGIEVPAYRFLAAGREPASDDLAALSGEWLVLKLVSPEVAHKAALGGVAVVPRSLAEVRRALAAMARRFAGRDVRGFTLHQHVPHSREPGEELLAGARWTPEFGPVVVWGLGGTDAERLASHLRPGDELAIASALGGGLEAWRRSLSRTLAGDLLAARPGAPAGGPPPDLEAVHEGLQAAARELMPVPLAELEINPLVFSGGRWLALDVLGKLGAPPPPLPAARPLAKIGRLLHPRSIALAGVSRQGGPGAVILDKLLAGSFDRERLWVVRPGGEPVTECRTAPDLGALPETVDLLIVAVGAERAVAVVEEAVALGAAESVIVISGGLGETPGTEALADRLSGAVARSRGAPGGGPVVNGGNCLGVRSAPGGYDALFLPPHKLDAAASRASDVAIVSQSGALLAVTLNRLPGVAFRYCVSIGNQADLTVGDYLAWFARETEVRVVALYAEGFRPLDGQRAFEAAAAIHRRGGTVVLYRGGRSAAGSRAAASHTARLAGDHRVAAALASEAGVVMAETLGDFHELIQLFAMLPPPAGRRLAVVTNAGYESVAACDGLGGLELAALGAETRDRLAALLREARLEGVVAAGNPLDLTPMVGDGAFAEAARLALADGAVDLGVVGCVPLTPALDTLAAGAGHGEDVTRPGSVTRRLIALGDELGKPWVVVVDGGGAYEPMRRLLAEAGVPTFDAMDRAVRLLGVFCARYRAG